MSIFSDTSDEEYCHMKRKRQRQSSIQSPIPSQIPSQIPKTSPEKKKLKTSSYISKREFIPSTLSKDEAISLLKYYLSPYITRVSNNIFIRITYYNFIIEYIKDIPKNICFTKDDDKDVYVLNDTIFLSKKIGSVSVYGIVYKSYNRENYLFRIATKITKNTPNNKKEIEIASNLSNLVITNKNPHFVIIYNNYECNIISTVSQSSHHDLMKSNYLILLNELANGDANMFYSNIVNELILKKNIDIDLLYNSLFQIIISIYSFHCNTGYIHHDAHIGNFLFHKVNKGGYIYYKINDEDYYCENNGYLWVIWDFGGAKMKNNGKEYYIDYLRILDHLYSYRHDIKKDGGFFDIINRILNELYRIKLNAYNEILDNENEFINFVMTLIYDKINKKKIIPEHKLIINKVPYIIKN